MLTFPLKLTMVNREFAKQETEPRNQSCKYPANPKTESQIQTIKEEGPSMSSNDEPKQFQNPNKSTTNDHVIKSQENCNHQPSKTISIPKLNLNP